MDLGANLNSVQSSSVLILLIFAPLRAATRARSVRAVRLQRGDDILLGFLLLAPAEEVEIGIHEAPLILLESPTNVKLYKKYLSIFCIAICPGF